MRNFITNTLTIAVIATVAIWMFSVLSETPEQTCAERENAHVSYEECVRSLERAPR
jgi:hypothetical protein